MWSGSSLTLSSEMAHPKTKPAASTAPVPSMTDVLRGIQNRILLVDLGMRVAIDYQQQDQPARQYG